MQSRGAASAQARGLSPCAHCVVAAQCPVMLHRSLGSGPATPLPVPQIHRRNSLLQRGGDRPTRLAFVKQGLMAVRHAGPDGSLRAIALIGPGNLLGQAAAFPMPAIFNVQAVTPVAVCHFPPRLLQDLAAAAGGPALPLQHLRLVLQTLADWSRLARLPGLSARFAMALQLLAAMQPARPLLVPGQAVLAELLGVTRESVNRAWRDFEARGIVRHRQGQTVDLDLPRLAGLPLQPG